MRRLVMVISALLCAGISFAFDTGVSRGDRIAILQGPSGRDRGSDEVLRSMPRLLEGELRRAGFDVRLVDTTLDRLAEGRSAVDYVVEVLDAEGDGHTVAGVGTGGRVGSVGVGGEIGVVHARVSARIRIYDGDTLEALDTFEVHASASSPALTGVGLGDRHGYVYVRLPFFTRHPYRNATRSLARKAALELRRDLRIGE